MENACTLKEATGNLKYNFSLLGIDFHRFLDFAGHKQMVKAKNLDKIRRVGELVRVKNRFRP